MFTLAVSCLTTSNSPWFIDLTFQVPMQYFSSQHWILLPLPVTSTTGHCFHFGSFSSLFWSHFSTGLSAYWAPSNPRSSSFIFILFMRFSRQEYWSGFSIVVLHSGCTNLHSHQQYKRIPFSLQSPAFIVCKLYNAGHSDQCEVYLIVVLICISLIISDVEYLFIWLLAICIFLWRNVY